MHDKIFKWTCLCVLIFSLSMFYLLLNEARIDAKAGLATLNANLQTLITNTTSPIQQIAHQAESIEKGTRSLISDTQNKLDYGNQLLNKIAESGGVIGKQLPFGILIKKVPAQEWAAKARNEVKILSLSAYDKDEMLYRIGTGIIGDTWYIQIPGHSPESLTDWLTSSETPN